MDLGERAEQLFSSGVLCAEAVLTVLAERQGIDSAVIPKIATGFCSGLSRSCGPCGAMAGAVMGLGLAHGRQEPDGSDESREELLVCFSVVQEFLERFTERFGSVNCLELTGCDFNTAEGQRRFREGGVRQQCGAMVRDAANMAAELLEE